MEDEARTIQDIKREIKSKITDIDFLTIEINAIMDNVKESISARYNNETGLIESTYNEITLCGISYLNELDIMFFNRLRETTGLSLFISICEKGLKVELYYK